MKQSIKTYRRRFSVAAYQNKDNDIQDFRNWFKSLKLKNVDLDISKDKDCLKVIVFSEDGYESTFYIYQEDWFVYEFGKFYKYLDKEFKTIFVENKEV